jgi:type III secretory pathway component EscU
LIEFQSLSALGSQNTKIQGLEKVDFILKRINPVQNIKKLLLGNELAI